MQERWLHRQQLARIFRSRLDERFPGHGLFVETYSGGLCVVTRIGEWRSCGAAEQYVEALDRAVDLDDFCRLLDEAGMVQPTNDNSSAVD